MTAVEAQVVARVADDYRRRGYDVEVEPAANALPEFLYSFHPDLIARKPGDESVVVEVKVGTRTSAAEQLRGIAERVNQQPGWRFSLVFADAERPDQITEAVPPRLDVVEERVRNAQALMGARQDEAAFLLLWSALEGAFRLTGERERGFRVLKVLAIDPGVVSIRMYKQTFDKRPSNIDPAKLSLGSINDADGFGIGHLPIDPPTFSSWEPRLLRRSSLTDEELEGYRMWKESGGGAFK